MTARFEHQGAVVTGAGEGIGYEIARRLALEGASVLLNDLDAGKAARAAASVRSEGGRCEATGGDVADEAVVQGLVEQAVAAFGRLDIVVANAGLTQWAGFLDYERADFRRVIDVNLGGSFFLAQAGARQMKRQGGGGRILLMSSVVGHRAFRGGAVYGMTKAALEMLARHLVAELAPLGITVNAVAPGATMTPRTLTEDPQYETAWSRVTPTRRVGETADVAAAALFLLSPAARHITGQTLLVDGGWTAVSRVPEEENTPNEETVSSR